MATTKIVLLAALSIAPWTVLQGFGFFLLLFGFYWARMDSSTSDVRRAKVVTEKEADLFAVKHLPSEHLTAVHIHFSKRRLPDDAELNERERLERMEAFNNALGLAMGGERERLAGGAAWLPGPRALMRSCLALVGVGLLSDPPIGLDLKLLAVFSGAMLFVGIVHATLSMSSYSRLLRRLE